MDRFFSAAMLAALLLLAPARALAGGPALTQPVFFSMLFPQLMPQESALPFIAPLIDAAPGEAVCL